jgi:hypothetical protein
VAGFAFMAAGFLPSAGRHAHSVNVIDLIVGGIALAAGLYFGRARGLRHTLANMSSVYAVVISGG